MASASSRARRPSSGKVPGVAQMAAGARAGGQGLQIWKIPSLEVDSATLQTIRGGIAPGQPDDLR